MSITQSIVDVCSERAGEARVARVTVEIGCLCAVLPDAVRFCYEVCAAGTPLEGSRLEIVAVPATAQCRSCGERMTVNDWHALCACGSADLTWSGGEELRVREMEIVECA